MLKLSTLALIVLVLPSIISAQASPLIEYPANYDAAEILGWGINNYPDCWVFPLPALTMVKDDRVFLLSSTTADSTDGKAAADAWCTSRNFTSAGDFQIQNWPTDYPVLTLTADAGNECEDTCTDMKCKCSSYKFVECFRGAAGAGCGKTFKDNSGVDNNGSGNFGVTNIGNYNNGSTNVGDFNFGSTNVGSFNLGSANWGSCLKDVSASKADPSSTKCDLPTTGTFGGSLPVKPKKEPRKPKKEPKEEEKEEEEEKEVVAAAAPAPGDISAGLQGDAAAEVTAGAYERSGMAVTVVVGSMLLALF